MDKVRFEVTLNGEHLCTTGVDGYGVLMLGVTALYSTNSSVAEDEATPITSTVSLNVGGAEDCDASTIRHLVWGETSLKEGDEVSFRVLPDGKHDPPIATFADPESGCPWKGPKGFRTDNCGADREDPERERSVCGNVRFEILRNGQRFCIAGRYSAGVLAMLLQCITHHPDRVRRLLAEKKPAKDQLDTTIMGFHTGQPNPVLSEGDEIIIRVLAPGECDPPVQPRTTGNPDWASRARVYGRPDPEDDG